MTRVFSVLRALSTLRNKKINKIISKLFWRTKKTVVGLCRKNENNFFPYNSKHQQHDVLYGLYLLMFGKIRHIAEIKQRAFRNTGSLFCLTATNRNMKNTVIDPQVISNPISIHLMRMCCCDRMCGRDHCYHFV